MCSPSCVQRGWLRFLLSVEEFLSKQGWPGRPTGQGRAGPSTWMGTCTGAGVGSTWATDSLSGVGVVWCGGVPLTCPDHSMDSGLGERVPPFPMLKINPPQTPGKCRKQVLFKRETSPDRRGPKAGCPGESLLCLLFLVCVPMGCWKGQYVGVIACVPRGVSATP